MYLKDRTFISSLSLSDDLFFPPLVSPKWPRQGGGGGGDGVHVSFPLLRFFFVFFSFFFFRSALFGLYNREGKNVCANIFRRSWLAFIRCSPATLDMNFRAASLCTCIPTIGRPYSPRVRAQWCSLLPRKRLAPHLLFENDRTVVSFFVRLEL